MMTSLRHLTLTTQLFSHQMMIPVEVYVSRSPSSSTNFRKLKAIDRQPTTSYLTYNRVYRSRLFHVCCSFSFFPVNQDNDRPVGMSSTYLEIRALANELNSTKVRDRRAAGEQLQQRLSRVEVRQRLAQEAQGNSQALAEMWGLILMNAIVSVQKMIGKTSTKVTATDLLLPFKLLRCCNLDDTNNNNNNMYQESASSKLSRKTTKLVFSYCYDLLQDDNALELAEVHVLEMMAYLCARKEYVAYMRPHVEMHAVVQQVEMRLTSTDDDVRPPVVVVTAGQIFENLLTTSKALGVGMHLLLPGCIKMLAIWCANNRNTNRTAVGFSHIFRGLSALLSSDPEQAIAPLTRHGRPILSFAKRRYSFANGKDRNALEEYFLAHL